MRGIGFGFGFHGVEVGVLGIWRYLPIYTVIQRYGLAVEAGGKNKAVRIARGALFAREIECNFNHGATLLRVQRKVFLVESTFY